MKEKNCRDEIVEIVEKIDNEEYLELIRRFAERLLDGGMV